MFQLVLAEKIKPDLERQRQLINTRNYYHYETIFTSNREKEHPISSNYKIRMYNQVLYSNLFWKNKFTKEITVKLIKCIPDDAQF